MSMHDFIVVGGGIAGLAIAELLQRSGRGVLLLEARERLCARSSAEQQGWFHTGALYAGLPSSRFFRQLVGNLDDLQNYYGGFPRMNLAAGRHMLTRDTDGWFGNELTFYFYASPRDPSINLWRRPIWSAATLRAQTRLAWFEALDFNRELSPQIRGLTFSPNLGRCVSRRAFNIKPGRIGTVLRSRDRTFHSERIAADLLASFLTHGGEFRGGAPVERIEHGRVVENGRMHRARQIILAAGRQVHELTSIRAAVHKSPLLVVTPALNDVNFVWMTMRTEETFNHLRHRADGADYSLIGNAAYYPVNAEIDEAAVKARLLSRARRTFGREIQPEQAELYFGYKTEVCSKKARRNYQYYIIDTENCVVALPGKMSLAFSLAVNVCRHFGVDPVSRVADLGELSATLPIEPTRHCVLTRGLLSGAGHAGATPSIAAQR